MGNDLLKASGRPELIPAGLGDPEPVLALVCEVPGALVQAPQAGGVGGCCLIEHEEAAVQEAAMDVGQRLCMVLLLLSTDTTITTLAEIHVERTFNVACTLHNGSLMLEV